MRGEGNQRYPELRDAKAVLGVEDLQLSQGWRGRTGEETRGVGVYNLRFLAGGPWVRTRGLRR